MTRILGRKVFGKSLRNVTNRWTQQIFSSLKQKTHKQTRKKDNICVRVKALTNCSNLMEGGREGKKMKIKSNLCNDVTESSQIELTFWLNEASEIIVIKNVPVLTWIDFIWVRKLGLPKEILRGRLWLTETEPTYEDSSGCGVIDDHNANLTPKTHVCWRWTWKKSHGRENRNNVAVMLLLFYFLFPFFSFQRIC